MLYSTGLNVGYTWLWKVNIFWHNYWKPYLFWSVSKASKSVIVWIPMLQVQENINIYDRDDIYWQPQDHTQDQKEDNLNVLLIVFCSIDSYLTKNYLPSMCHFIRRSITSDGRMKSCDGTEVISNNKSSKTKTQGGRHLGQYSPTIQLAPTLLVSGICLKTTWRTRQDIESQKHVSQKAKEVKERKRRERGNAVKRMK